MPAKRHIRAAATGKTGLWLVNELKARGHDPVALVRENSDTSALPQGVALRHGEIADLQDTVCESCDVVIFAAGSGSGTRPDMTDNIGRDGAKRLIDLAARSKVSRFVMLSTVGAGDPDPDSKLAQYLQAKHDADEHLKASGLDYAILRPVRLTEEDGSREIRLGDDVDAGAQAARGDVAFVLANLVDDSAWSDKALLMQSA